MKKLFRIIFALAYLLSYSIVHNGGLISGVNAGMLINPFSVAAAGSGNVIAISYLGHFEDAGTATTYNFTSSDYGVAAADRYIAVAAARGGTAANTLSSCTLNTQACSISATQGANLSSTGIGIALVASGTTGLTTSITWSGSASGCGITLFRMVGGGTITFQDSAQTTTDPVSILADVKGGGAAVYVEGCRTGGAATGVAGYTLDLDNVVTAGTGIYFSGHYQAGAVGDENNRAFTLDTGGDRHNAIVATFQPS